MEPIEEYERNGLAVKIFIDESPSSPREWSNVGTMIHWHRSYELGDEQLGGDREAIFQRGYSKGGMQEALRYLERYLRLVEGATVVLPLSLLDHSGVTMWVGGGAHWSDPGGWDSGTIGVIFDTPEGREECGTPLDRIEEVLRSEVSVFDQYLTGDIYGYVIEDSDGAVVDSCWGFYGLDETKPEADAMVDAIDVDEIEKARRQRRLDEAQRLAESVGARVVAS